MESLPFELAEIIVKELRLKDKCNFRLVSKWCNEQVVATHPVCFRMSEYCEIEELQLRRYGWSEFTINAPRDFISFHARIYRYNSSLHFERIRRYFAYDGSADAQMQQREKALKKLCVERAIYPEEGEKLRREIHFTLRFPPRKKLGRQYALFTKAKIRHLEIYREYPFYIDKEKYLKILTRMFRGCEIEHVSFMFDKMSIENMPKTPSFLSSVGCRIVQFVLNGNTEFDLLQHFCSQEFPRALAAAGIEEVRLRNQWRHRKQRPLDRLLTKWTHPHHGYDKPAFFFDPLLNLIEAGIARFSILPDVLENICSKFKREELDEFLDIIASSEKPLYIKLYLTDRSDLPPGKYKRKEREDDEKNGLEVDVEKRRKNDIGPGEWTRNTHFLKDVTEIIVITTKGAKEEEAVS